jgi:hypothetical protein
MDAWQKEMRTNQAKTGTNLKEIREEMTTRLEAHMQAHDKKF